MVNTVSKVANGNKRQLKSDLSPVSFRNHQAMFWLFFIPSLVTFASSKRETVSNKSGKHSLIIHLINIISSVTTRLDRLKEKLQKGLKLNNKESHYLLK